MKLGRRITTLSIRQHAITANEVVGNPTLTGLFVRLHELVMTVVLLNEVPGVCH